MHLTVGIETVSASLTMATLLRCVLRSAGLAETKAIEHFHFLVERDIDFRRPLPLGFLGRGHDRGDSGDGTDQTGDVHYPGGGRRQLALELASLVQGLLGRVAKEF